MLDTMLRPTVEPHLNKIAAKCFELGIGPNQITFYGFAIGLVGCVAIGLQSYFFGLLLILLNRLADGLDGAVARYNKNQEGAKQQSPFGEYLDTILDMILFSAFIFLFVLGQPHQASAAIFLMFSFVGLFITYLGSYIVKAKTKQSEKPFFHPTRMIEDTEIVLFIILACLYTEAFSAIAVLFGIVCWFTTISRIWYAYFDLKVIDNKKDDSGTD